MDAQPDPADNAQVTPSINPTPEASAAPPAPATPPPIAALPGVPGTWPGAFGVYKHSKQAVKLNLGPLVLLWIINIVVGGGVEFALKKPGDLIALIISSLVTVAMTLIYLAGIRGKRMELGEAFSQALPLWLKMIGLMILVWISTVISLLLLIIPFFFVFPRLLLSYYFLVDKKMGVIDSYKASWNATQGNVGKVWGIFGATILMVLLMITIIGIPFSIYFLVMYGAAYAVLYEFINTKSPAAAAPAVAPIAPAADPSVSPTPPAPIVQ